MRLLEFKIGKIMWFDGVVGYRICLTSLFAQKVLSSSLGRIIKGME